MGLGVGTRLGPFEVLSKIGQGGMGEVYRCQDTRLGRLVAIKLLNSTPRLAQEQQIYRFQHVVDKALCLSVFQ